jgi:hypothetical protein
MTGQMLPLPDPEMSKADQIRAQAAVTIFECRRRMLPRPFLFSISSNAQRKFPEIGAGRRVSKLSRLDDTQLG